MVGFNAKNIPFAGASQGLFDIANAIHGIRCNPRKRILRNQRTVNHRNSKRRLGGKGYSIRYLGRGKPHWIIDPTLGQVQSTIDKGMAASRYMGGEHANLALRYLASRSGVLASNTTGGLALFEKTGFIDD